tara:strand:+ start:185 stop:466 length:282 start_codon:yes stop_codon:yes gene_type:complete
MKITKFLNIDIEPAPPELELEVEMQCREIMKSNDLDNVKRYCTYMVKKKFDQDIFMASLLNRLIELEADKVVKQIRKEKTKSTNPIKKFFRIP